MKKFIVYWITDEFILLMTLKWSLWHYNQSVISVWFLKQDALISMTISMLHRHSKLKYLKIKGWVQKILGQTEIQTEYSVIIVLLLFSWHGCEENVKGKVSKDTKVQDCPHFKISKGSFSQIHIDVNYFFFFN